jgi:hypothetical protein
MPVKTYTELVNEASSATLEAAKQAQRVSLQAIETSFDFAGELLSLQRAYAIGAVEAFTRTAKKAA